MNKDLLLLECKAILEEKGLLYIVAQAQRKTQSTKDTKMPRTANYPFTTRAQTCWTRTYCPQTRNQRAQIIPQQAYNSVTVAH